jgi:hypothetical protein
MRTESIYRKRLAFVPLTANHPETVQLFCGVLIGTRSQIINPRFVSFIYKYAGVSKGQLTCDQDEKYVVNLGIAAK